MFNTVIATFREGFSAKYCYSVFFCCHQVKIWHIVPTALYFKKIQFRENQTNKDRQDGTVRGRPVQEGRRNFAEKALIKNIGAA